MSRADKRMARENTIRSMTMAAWRVDTKESGEVTYETIRRHCPEFTPRQMAMVRSIAVNNGIVDEPIDWWD